ncbi:MAG: BamA/TamA family outer membrane protein [Bacteroidales bacterium]
MNRFRKSFSVHILLLLLILLSGCSTVKYVKQDEFLLSKLTIESDNKRLRSSELEAYVKQKPNQRVFGIFKMPLHIYSLSGRNDKLGINRFIKRVGEAPVIYNSELTDKTVEELTKVAQNKGFLHARIDTSVIYKKKKAYVTYKIHAGEPFRISEYEKHIKDPVMDSILSANPLQPKILNNMILDNGILEDERTRLISILRNNGYYALNKDLFLYYADSTEQSNQIQLSLESVPKTNENRSAFDRFRISKIIVDTSFDPLADEYKLENLRRDTIFYKGVYIVENLNDIWLKSKYIDQALYFHTGDYYNESSVNATYSAFSRMPAIKFINIRFNPVSEDSDELVCLIELSKAKSQSFSTELEGTHSAGDLGAAVAFSYKHGNIFKGSEMLTFKVRGAYEQLHGTSITDNYTEFGGETSINFPRFLFPILHSSVRKKIRANTEFALSYNYQHRPEFTRVIAGGAWRYKWTVKEQHRHTFDFVDLSYTYLPRMSDEFKNEMDQINVNPVLRYSYENHFILRTGYTYYKTNNVKLNKFNPIRYTFRAGAESAGNALYAISSLTKAKKVNGGYEMLGIRYAQYVKGDLDYAMTYRIDKRNYIAWHVGFGVAYPYGNMTVIPYEKRYFAGGANSVRAWNVRTLGPGRYRRTEGIDFINQSGDIKLDLSVEYRSYLFWKLHGAIFIDAGNIWTLRKYDNQPGGQFQFDTFYKEIALGYGAGIRADFDYFVLRLDLGIKAYDPSLYARDSWRLIQPGKNDFVLNFAVGYPF